MHLPSTLPNSLLRPASSSLATLRHPENTTYRGFLSHLTGGRYDRLIVDETDSGQIFHVAGPAVPESVPLASPLSTGTLEQAYLSLRLAIVDHLDQGRARLPVFVDGVLVNWDRERRARGIERLAEARACSAASAALALQRLAATALDQAMRDHHRSQSADSFEWSGGQ